MASIKTIPTNAVTERASSIAGTRIFSVVSRTTNGKEYTVTVNETVRCTCLRARMACWHKQEVGAYMLAHDYTSSGPAQDEDAKLQDAVGAWWTKTYGTMTAQEVLDAEEEREEVAFWQDFTAAREMIISAVMTWIDGYLPKEQPMQQPCKAECGRAAGPTGLCQPCLMVQEALRKTETRKAQAARIAAYKAQQANEPFFTHAELMTLQVALADQDSTEDECDEVSSNKAQTCTRTSRWNDDRVFDPISGWKSAS